MVTKVQKWGNSLAVRVPKQVAESLRLKAGTKIQIETDLVSQTFKIRRALAKPVYTLKQLLKGVTAENMHREVDWGKPVGREVW